MLEETKAPNLLIYFPLITLGKSGQPEINKLMAMSRSWLKCKNIQTKGKIKKKRGQKKLKTNSKLKLIGQAPAKSGKK